MLKWGRVALKWLGRSPGRCRSPSPAQSQGGCAAGTGQGTGLPAPKPTLPAPQPMLPAPQPTLPVPRLGGQPKGQQPASPAEPESHAQHEKGEEKVTITTSATTSPRGNDHLTATLHTMGGREDGERSLVGLGNREPVLEHTGGHGHGSSRLLRGTCCGVSVSSQAAGTGTPSVCPRVSASVWGAKQWVRLSPHWGCTPAAQSASMGSSLPPLQTRAQPKRLESSVRHPKGFTPSFLNTLIPKLLGGGGAAEKEV